MIFRSTIRDVSLCLYALAAACGGDPADASSGGGTSSSGDEPTTAGPTSTTAQAPTTTDGSTAGTTSGESDDGSGTTAQATLTSGEPEPTCGDGVKTGKEECDDGNRAPDDGCEPGCVITAVCGNGVVETGEVCDDGNTEEGDTCSADCITPMVQADCGDGVVQDPEQCDDGNQIAGDGCEPDCSIGAAVCGNGEVEEGEACDDGNVVDGGPDDFCHNDCSVSVPENCKVPIAYKVCDAGLDLADKSDPTQAHRAIGICDDQPDNSVQISDFTLESPTAAAWQVARGFGKYAYDHDKNPNTPNKLLYSPREGETFLMISTGVIHPPNADGVVIEQPNSQNGNGDNGNDDSDALPAPLRTQKGSNDGLGGDPFQACDGVNDCSDTLEDQWALGQADPQDRLWFSFNATVPAGTRGYSFDFVFCSAEWPFYVDTGFNDLLIVYQVDPSPDDPNAMPPVDPYTGNITFIPDPNDDTKGLPLTITALDPYFKGPGYTNFEPQLKGTGFEGSACTDWITAKGGVEPGAELTLSFFIADMSDDLLATVALLDNFRWDCEGCAPSEVDDCGVQAPQ